MSIKQGDYLKELRVKNKLSQENFLYSITKKYDIQDTVQNIRTAFISLFFRQLYRNGCALIFLAFHLNRSAEIFGSVLNNCKSKTCAACFF